LNIPVAATVMIEDRYGEHKYIQRSPTFTTEATDQNGVLKRIIINLFLEATD